MSGGAGGVAGVGASLAEFSCSKLLAPTTLLFKEALADALWICSHAAFGVYH